MTDALEQVTIPAGTIIHFRGMPFRLPVDTVVEGRKANYEAVRDDALIKSVNAIYDKEFAQDHSQ